MITDKTMINALWECKDARLIWQQTTLLAGILSFGQGTFKNLLQNFIVSKAPQSTAKFAMIVHAIWDLRNKGFHEPDKAETHNLPFSALARLAEFQSVQDHHQTPDVHPNEKPVRKWKPPVEAHFFSPRWTESNISVIYQGSKANKPNDPQ
jgi:hypothetical protein